MLLKSMVKPKQRLTTVQEDATLEEALKILEDSGFRCVPILDKTGRLFRGNIYKMHIYRHKSRGGSMQDPVTSLLKNATKYINLSAAFFTVFFTIKDLPYITVLDDNNYFYGILTHARLLDALSQSWNTNVGSYVITVVSSDERGDLATSASVITLDSNEDELIHRTLFTLPAGVPPKKLQRIISNLERKGFKVPEVEDLQSHRLA